MLLGKRVGILTGRASSDRHSSKKARSVLLPNKADSAHRSHLKQEIEKAEVQFHLAEQQIALDQL